MILSDSKILEMMKKGELVISPILDIESQLQGAKVDLRLDNTFLKIRYEQKPYHDTFKSGGNEEKDEFHFDSFTVPYTGKIVLHPHDFLLGQTFEMVCLPNNLMGHLGGKSSIARQGIIVHATASVVDPGFNGVLCLELTNFGKTPVLLHPLMPIASIAFSEIRGEVKKSYKKQKESKFGGRNIQKEWEQESITQKVIKNWDI